MSPTFFLALDDSCDARCRFETDQFVQRFALSWSRAFDPVFLIRVDPSDQPRHAILVRQPIARLVGSLDVIWQLYLDRRQSRSALSLAPR